MIEFNFSSSETPEETQEIIVPVEEVRRIFAPGMYEVQIRDVEDCGAPEKDPTWRKLRITAASVDERVTTFTIFVPTKTLAYGAGKGISVLWKQGTMPFLKALGVHEDRLVSGADITKVLPALLGEPEKLIGCFLKVKLGYESNYVQKDRADGKLKVYSPDGQQVAGSPVWDTYEEQKAYTAQTGIKYAFLNVMSYEAMVSAPNYELLKNISKGRIDNMLVKHENSPF